MKVRKTYQGKTAAVILRNAHVELMEAGNYEIVTRSGLIVRGWGDLPGVIGLQDSYGDYVTYLQLDELAQERYCTLLDECNYNTDLYTRYSRY